MNAGIVGLAILAALAANPAAAQERIVPPAFPPAWAGQDLLTPTAVRAQATLRDQVARVVVEQDYVNPTSRPLEGSVCFPLARDASISDFAMLVDGRRLEGVLLDADQARETYERIVRARKDPALLELLGRGMLRARLFPIPPGGTRTLRIEYGQVLRATGSRTEFTLPFVAGEGARPVPFTATVTVRTRGRLGPVYSPTHALECTERSGHEAVVTARGEALPGRDLTMLVAEDRTGLGAEVVTARRGDEAGYFLLFAMPWQERARRAPADVIFALDVSGSMSGAKMEQARRSLLYCLDRLGPDDRFAIAAFSAGVTPFRDQLTRGTPDALRAARAFVRDLEAGGGTNLDEALSAALRLARDGRDPMIVLLTDGQPTVGVTSIPEIEARAQNRRPDGAHLFTFGVGYDVNAPFLDRLASGGRGASDYVKPEEDIEEKVTSLFEKISSPVLRNVTVTVHGAHAFDLCPRTVSDLFHGEQLVVLGRFEGRGDATVTVRGDTPDGRHLEVSAPMDRAPARGRNAYVPTLWASRRIATLMDQARLEGETPDLRETIVALSKEYGILTPYTSYYVSDREEAQAWNAPAGGDALVRSKGSGPTAGPQRVRAAAPAPEVGKEAVQRSLDMAEQKSAASLDRAASVAGRAAGGAPAGFVAASGHLFESRNGVWTDTRHAATQRVIQIAPWSDAYMTLLTRHPDLAAAAALGEHVILAGRGLSIEIVAGGRASLDAAQWAEIARALQG
jgi:Ca-activated chloride channel family protein